MNALDTNILVRYFVKDPDDKEAVVQHQITKKILMLDSFIPLTVILEFFWVLASRYKLPKEVILQAFNLLFVMPQITIDHRNLVQNAITLYANGMDFADALHWVQASHCERLYTFDQNFIKKAKSNANFAPVIEPF